MSSREYSKEVQKQIKSFNDLVPAAAALHKWTYCRKNQMKRHTAYLKGDECCLCSHFVLNEGICDPL